MKIERAPMSQDTQRNLAGWLLFLSALFPVTAVAQRPYTVVRPAERSPGERPLITRRATQPSKIILAVLLEPIITGKVVVTDARGKVVAEGEADSEQGRVDFELRRGQAYTIKASSPGYVDAERKTKVLKTSQPFRVPLNAQFARLDLPGLPPNASVLIDKQLVATADQSGSVTLANITPGTHTLLIRHREYNDYQVSLPSLEAGTAISFPHLSTVLTKVAKLNFQTSPNATILIDGAVQGRVNANGQVNIDYDLPQAGEHTLRVELLGYEPWEQQVALTPGPRKIEAKLTPLVTSAGASDIFDNLNLWAAPAEWSLFKEGANSKLQVSSKSLGLLKNTLYRNFEALFTVWLVDGKGASWAVRADKEGKRYYLFHLAGANAANGLTPRRFYTYLVEDGNITEVVTPTTVLSPLKAQENYTVRLTVENYVIRHYITSNNINSPDLGKPDDLGVFTDTSTSKERSLYGSFGFLASQGEVFQVDDFNLEPKP
jgi:hypothetical protein